MRELRFHVHGVMGRPRHQGRHQWRRQSRFTSPSLVSVVFVAAVAAGISRGVLFTLPAHVASVYGTAVRGNHVLMLRDISGSMGGTDRTVDTQIGTLEAAGISLTDRADIPGFSISFTDTYSLLPALLAGINANPAVDTIYILSDFSAGDHHENEPEAVQHLARVLRERHIRLYSASVRDRPIAIYYDLARHSGGGVIRSM